ncbi:hypothetical protein MHYP_G00236190 [Metynnis hypsauchen]
MSSLSLPLVALPCGRGADLKARKAQNYEGFRIEHKHIEVTVHGIPLSSPPTGPNAMTVGASSLGNCFVK